MTEPAAEPDIRLERYRLNELQAAEAARIARLAESDPAVAARLHALDRSDDDIRTALPPGDLARAIRRRLHDRRATLRPGLRAVVRVGVPCGVVLLLAVLAGWPAALRPSSNGSVAGEGASGDRIKGLGASLAVYRRTEAGSELLVDGVRAETGDVLRIGYKVADAGYGVIASVDGRGVVTLHLPPEEGRAARLLPGEAVLLDHAYELDDAPKWERFYLVTAATPFDVAPVVAAVRATARLGDAPPPLALPPALDQTTFVIHKD